MGGKERKNIKHGAGKTGEERRGENKGVEEERMKKT